MKNRLIIVLLFFSTISYADFEVFDVAEIEINKHTYYLRYWSPGTLIEDCLCYRVYFEEGLVQGRDILAQYFRDGSNTTLHKEFHKINLDKIPELQWGTNDKLHILKKEISIDAIENIQDFQLKNITRGNAAGFTYSPDLNENDNTWLNDYSIEMYFKLFDYELCEMGIYGIKDNLSPEFKQELHDKLDALLKEYKQEEFHLELKKLYKEGIIMIGFCSC